MGIGPVTREPDESVLRYAGSQLKSVRDSIDREITEVAPSWKSYLTKYAQLSKPIDARCSKRWMK